MKLFVLVFACKLMTKHQTPLKVGLSHFQPNFARCAHAHHPRCCQRRRPKLKPQQLHQLQRPCPQSSEKQEGIVPRAPPRLLGSCTASIASVVPQAMPLVPQLASQIYRRIADCIHLFSPDYKRRPTTPTTPRPARPPRTWPRAPSLWDPSSLTLFSRIKGATTSWSRSSPSDYFRHPQGRHA
jgi:hypothetical protein